MSRKMPTPNKKDARRRRARKKRYLGNVVRLRGTWSEGYRGEEGCLAASGDLGQLFPETLATGALCQNWFPAESREQKSGPDLNFQVEHLDPVMLRIEKRLCRLPSLKSDCAELEK